MARKSKNRVKTVELFSWQIDLLRGMVRAAIKVADSDELENLQMTDEALSGAETARRPGV